MYVQWDQGMGCATVVWDMYSMMKWRLMRWEVVISKGVGVVVERFEAGLAWRRIRWVTVNCRSNHRISREPLNRFTAGNSREDVDIQYKVPHPPDQPSTVHGERVSTFSSVYQRKCSWPMVLAVDSGDLERSCVGLYPVKLSIHDIYIYIYIYISNPKRAEQCQ
jgi:hypothetical protein